MITFLRFSKIKADEISKILYIPPLIGYNYMSLNKACQNDRPGGAYDNGGKIKKRTVL